MIKKKIARARVIKQQKKRVPQQLQHAGLPEARGLQLEGVQAQAGDEGVCEPEPRRHVRLEHVRRGPQVKVRRLLTRRNLSSFNHKPKKLKQADLSYVVPKMISNYANNIIAKPVFPKKHIKNCRLAKDAKKIDDSRTRNPQSAIFKTNDTAPYQLTSESYLQIKSGKLRRVKKRSSTSNSHSKAKHNKSTTAHALGQNVKSSSRTNSTFGKGPLYQTFHHKEPRPADALFAPPPKDLILVSGKPKKPTHKNRNRGTLYFRYFIHALFRLIKF